MLVVLLGETNVSNAFDVNCSPLELTPCADAMMSNAPLTAECCGRLKEQTPCLCQYLLKDPNLKQFVDSPKANKVFSTCGVTSPTC